MSGGVLDEHGGETLHGAEGCTVDHHRGLLGVVFSGVFELEAHREVVVHLDGAQLPAASDGVLDHEVELGTVEGCLAIFYLGIEAFLLAGIDDGLLCFSPYFVATDVLLVVVRIAEGDLGFEVVEIEGGEDGLDDVHTSRGR